MSDDDYAIDPDTVVLDDIACTRHPDPTFAARARAAWEQVAGERDAAEAALQQGVRELQSPRFAALQRAASVWEQRALAAEAQLAAAREELPEWAIVSLYGAFSEEEYCAGFYAPCPESVAAFRNWLTRQRTRAQEPYECDLLAAWRAAQTEAR